MNNSSAFDGTGGIYMNTGTGSITNCTFTGNTSGNDYGGAIYWLNGTLTIDQSTFTDNSSTAGGGAIFAAAEGINTPVNITRSTFIGNSAPAGGALYLAQSSGATTITATNSLFLNNTASADGAVAAFYPNGTTNTLNLINSSFYGNSVTGSGATGLFSGGTSRVNITNSILYGDHTPNVFSQASPVTSSSVQFSDVEGSGFAGVNGNISADPLYVKPGGGDLHILSTSPAIGAGTIGADIPAVDFDGNPRGNPPDMGAFEGAPTHFGISAPATATAGNAFTFTVTAEDIDNNPIINYGGTVHFTSSDGSAVLPADTTLTDGVGTFSATLDTAGGQTIAAADTVTSGLTGTSNTVTVSPGATTQLLVTVPDPAVSYSNYTTTVTAEDAFHNQTNYNGTVTFTSSDPSFINPGPLTLSNGIGSENGAALKTAGTQTVTATDTVNPSITGTATTTVVPGPMTGLGISWPDNATTGVPTSITVYARDLFGNVIPNYTGTVHFSSSDPNATLPADTTLTNGIGTFNVTFNTDGNQTITVTDTSNPSFTATTDQIVVIGLVTHLGVTAAPTTTPAGSQIQVTVAALDASDNEVSGYNGTIHFTSSDTAAGLPADQVGNGAYAVILSTVGSQTITVTDTADSSINGTSNLVTVTPAAATQFAISAPATVTAGTPFTFTVTALDPFGNVATGYTGTVHFDSTNGTASLPADATLTNGTGTFTATLNTAGIQTITATDTASSFSDTSGSITVTPVVTPRTADLAINATSIVIGGTGFDPDKANDSVTFSDGAAGTVTAATPTSLTIAFSTPPTGPGSLTVVVTTNTVDSGSPVQIATVIGIPTANAQSVNVSENTATAVTLTGTDPDAPPLPLTYTVTTNPTHGTLTGTAPNLTYTPDAGYFGPDSFQFTDANGTLTSAPATVTLTDIGTPAANAQSVTTAEGVAAAITLTGSDPNTPPRSLTYTVTVNPAHGTLSGTAPNLTYTPDAGYFGPDSFQFTDTNGTLTSTPATVTLTVVGTPTATAQSVTTAVGTATAVTLTGSDPNTPPRAMTYIVTANPVHGTLSGTAPNLTYTPDAGYFGTDSFQFKVNNGTADSIPATVSLAVINSPTADDQSVTLAEGGNAAITLTGADSNVPPLPLTYTVTVAPAHGTLSGTAPDLTYTPDAGYFGPDSFQFTDTNGTVTSTPAAVTFTVVGTPTANAQTVTTGLGTAAAVTLTGTDPNTPPLSLTYTITANPTHGTLSGTAPDLTYTPDAGYFGPDSFQFTDTNGTATSTPAAVTFTVVGIPTANAQTVTTAQGTAAAVTLTGTDPNTPPLSLAYTVTTGPSHGTLSGTAPDLTYTPDAGYFGPDSFQFTDTNGTTTSAPATVSLTIVGTPTATAQTETTAEGTAVAVTLTGTDPNTPPQSLTFTVTTGPAHGTLTGTGADLTYTPDAGYFGPIRSSSPTPTAPPPVPPPRCPSPSSARPPRPPRQ
ncbi:beta strand repeat-containing protein [Fimbriiglobus ruber]|nr:Ig-like domain-containing protein [Fimbriiglobus ruber]